MAIKAEPLAADCGKYGLANENRTYTALLAGKPQDIYIPEVLWYGEECGSRILVTPLLGKSLADLLDAMFELYDREIFTPNTIAKIAIIMVSFPFLSQAPLILW